MKHALAGVLLFLLLPISSHAQAPADSEVFKRAFGISRILPADLVAQVKALPAGKKLERDTNGDGKIDELWYLDTSKRNTISPLLVRAVDRDGDMPAMQRGDLDSDIYFWDYNADGTIDAVTVYQDDDHDGDVDQMGIFFFREWPDAKDSLTVWWAIDVGDDNLLWYDVNGNYDQPLCQWRTHFSGDEVFYQFRLTPSDPKWVNMWEDPFAFYDPDHDQCSEEVVRISAKGNKIENLRYSIDADNDAYGDNPHNYDFSITALPSPEGLTPGPNSTTTIKIMGIESLPVLSWEKTRAFAQRASWAKAMLTWDELNSNTDENVDQDPHERWEGILNHASKRGDFPQVGGPPSSAFNKRVEVSDKPASPLRLYWDDSDRRFHLLGAKYGYFDVDFNFDGVVDETYIWEDTNGDGVFDRCLIDADGDGAIDFEKPMTGNSKEFEIKLESFASFYPDRLRAIDNESQQFIDEAIDAQKGDMPEMVRQAFLYYALTLPTYHPECEIGERIQGTPAGARLYLDYVRDNLFVEARKEFGSQPGWKPVEEAYLHARYIDAVNAMEKLRGREANATMKHLWVNNGLAYKHRITVIVENPSDVPRFAEPIVLSVKELREHANTLRQHAGDFESDKCAVVDADYWLAWREIPHQIDDWDFSGDSQLSFLANLPAHATKSYYIFYDPRGTTTNNFPQLTRAVLDTPAYVAWESDAGAYRFYTGQFDFFGKHEGRLLPREKRLLYPIVGENYHAEQEWGMDALHVNKTSGLGGLTLYLADKEYPVQSPAGEGHVKFEHRMLGAGPIRAAVEITATNVIPEMPDEIVRLRCFSYAKRPECEITVQLPDGLNSPQLAPGLLRLNEDHPFAETKLGLIGTWGYQSEEIGEIGLGVIVPKPSVEKMIGLDTERRLRCNVANNRFNYWIDATWQRGMQNPIAPSVDNWHRTLANLADELNNPVRVKITDAWHAPMPSK